MHTVTVESNLDTQVQRLWEVEKVPEIYLESKPEHEHSEQLFKESMTLSNDRFEVKLPLKTDPSIINTADSFAIALQRFLNLEKRFVKEPEYYALYRDFIQEYLALGHAKVIDTSSCDPNDLPLNFIPHHGVLRLDKITNKLRVVFDGTAHTKNGPSLNDILCNGPVVQKQLYDILIAFRTYKYVIMCDIRHMYRQIMIHPDHRPLQNIIWRDDSNEPLQCLQLQTVTYGLTSSAYLATRCLIELANIHQSTYKSASQAVLQGSYCDDFLCGADTFQEASRLIKELIGLLQLGSFDLHKWCSNDINLLSDIPKSKYGFDPRDLNEDHLTVKTLGLSYDAKEDVFKMSGKNVTTSDKPTKRTVLSSISRMFDPLGFTGPIVVCAKLILQQIWRCNLEWDTPLPADQVEVWQNFYSSLINMPDIIIPRNLYLADSDETQIIGYCDASSGAYCCCIYIKLRINNTVHVHLLTSKSRLAPLNSKLTIPKLELNGALMLAKLVTKIGLLFSNVTTFNLFCDSQIVLSWLKSNSIKLPAYIGNRVHEINRLTQSASWHYTPSLLNPADVLSRGCIPQDLAKNTLWWHGPDYLCNTNDYNFYLSSIEAPLSIHPGSSEDTEINLAVIQDNKELLPFFTKLSSLHKMQHVMAYVLRFINMCRKRHTQMGSLSVKELQNAHLTIIKCIQKHYFSKEINAIKNNQVIASNL
ncbi:uncharacterized protein LOC126380309 isoform X1 [Pectinophora gossypiella]|uniref:uncharacterized protein LOC126380309 isoform X1 n=1 Tax=Pectinophora gossypiella TaxID=13191 RepID=UPI00214E8359|nr:uncharacterized protein LOC126380309 isoform X1 [Pectinophora gossypiella]